MRHRESLVSTSLGSVVTCTVAGLGIIRGGTELLDALRRNPVPPPGKPLPSSFLKHAEKQTVAGLAAVYQAVYNFDLARIDLQQWGVIAAPTFLGRSGMADALARFAIEGAWGISPHLIPHQSLHAVSGTISQALGLHGPNFGVGGAPGAVVEALVAAASLLTLAGLPGLWVVLTDHERELLPCNRADPAGKRGPEPDCRALALALMPRKATAIGFEMQICAHAHSSTEAPPDWHAWSRLHDVGDLIEVFSREECRGRWRLGAAGWLRLLRAYAETEREF